MNLDDSIPAYASAHCTYAFFWWKKLYARMTNIHSYRFIQCLFNKKFILCLQLILYIPPNARLETYRATRFGILN